MHICIQYSVYIHTYIHTYIYAYTYTKPLEPKQKQSKGMRETETESESESEKSLGEEDGNLSFEEGEGEVEKKLIRDLQGLHHDTDAESSGRKPIVVIVMGMAGMSLLPFECMNERMNEKEGKRTNE